MATLVFFTLPKERPNKIDIIGFETTESAELYFRNVRSFYYINKPEAGGIFDVYRLESIFVDSTPSLPFALYNNWRANETFIRLDTAFIDLRSTLAVVVDSGGVTTETIDLPEMSNESQYAFARDVYKALEASKKLGLTKPNETIWFSESMNSSMKRTLSDYFKLLGKL